ncbi:hypothetical protein [Lactiplantibacillus plantarum]|uniref:hypothetical protein n=1 Tax=Lactiplantibacillus plantarum TaxID=1590 RepID=UPI001BA9B7AB|nr:hypothetical protein [Lactiplantibacillus plantarum]MBS0937544.1 hypothetical protein [Lactiplantibacillus plantarum]MBS0944130.1 hypothetical protein [Lactiplantibacillus plantarum]
MIKIDECVAKPTEFNVIKITSELDDEVQKAFKNADKLDKKLDRPRNAWKAIFQYHGLIWTDIWGFEFIANYGKENQGRRQEISLNDRIIEDRNGEQFLIPNDLFERYFI